MKSLADPRASPQLDGVLMNPPYRHICEPITILAASPRVAPQSKADFAFSCMVINTPKQDEVSYIVLLTGSFSAAMLSEHSGVSPCWKKAIYYRDRPANIFFNTSIPTTVIILKKTGPPGRLLYRCFQGAWTRARTRTS